MKGNAGAQDPRAGEQGEFGTHSRSATTTCQVRFAGTALIAAAIALPAYARAQTRTIETPAVAPAWRPMADGAARATVTAGDIERSAIQLFKFDLSRFRPEVIMGDGKPPRGHTAAELVQRRGAVAAVNGGFFDERAAPLGLRIAAGITRAPLKAKSDWGVLSFTQSGRGRIQHTRDFAASRPTAPLEGTEKIRDAIQVGPRLVVDGAPVKLKRQFARRTAVALDRDGRTLTLVVAATPVDANELAWQLAQHGFYTAILLDGGPSTQLAVAAGDEKVDVPGGYPVPDLLALFTRQAPASPASALVPFPRPGHIPSPEKKASTSPTPAHP